MKRNDFTKILIITVLAISATISTNAQTTLPKEDSASKSLKMPIKNFGENFLRLIQSVKSPKDISSKNIERIIGVKNFGYDEANRDRFFSRTAVTDYQYWSFDFTNMEKYFPESDKKDYQLLFWFNYYRPVPEGQPSPTRPYPPPYISEETPGCNIDYHTFSANLQKDGFSLSKKPSDSDDNQTERHIFTRGGMSVNFYIQMIPSKTAQENAPIVTPGKDNQPTVINLNPNKTKLSPCVSAISVTMKN